MYNTDLLHFCTSKPLSALVSSRSILVIVTLCNLTETQKREAEPQGHFFCLKDKQMEMLIKAAKTQETHQNLEKLSSFSPENV